MADEDLKVNDKRMFTAEGELREEFRHLEDAETDVRPDVRPEARPETRPEVRPEGERRLDGGEAIVEEAARQPVEPPASQSASPTASRLVEPSSAPDPTASSSSASAPSTADASAHAPGEPSILDLVGLLAEHTALYLGEAQLPDGKSVRDLGAAKLHLDLLDVLRSKTAGNLTADESRVLEDILYRLRMIYVEKKRQE